MFFVTNKALVKGIQEHDSATLSYLYKKIFPQVKNIIENQGGGYDLANDIFQEAIILLFRKSQSNSLPTQLNVEAYLIGICKLIWKNEYRKETHKIRDIVNANEKMGYEDDGLLLEYRQSRRKKLFYEHFSRLQEECRNILQAFFEGMSFADIAKSCNLISEEYARRRKFLCKEYLVKSIKEDPLFSKLIGEYDDEAFE